MEKIHELSQKYEFNIIEDASHAIGGKYKNKSIGNCQYSDIAVLFMSISKAKFRKPIFPNDKVFFEVNFINKVKNVYKFFGIASKEKIKVSEAEFSAMITYAK